MSKIKKILCVVLLIVMCIPHVAFADVTATHINENFNSSTGTLIPGIDNWRSITFSGTGLSNGLQFSANNSNSKISAASDVVKGNKSLLFENAATPITFKINLGESSQANYGAGTLINLEFSFKAQKSSDAVALLAKNETTQSWMGQFFLKATGGKIYMNSTVTQLGTYKVGVWNHIVLCMNTTTQAYELYVNNECVKTGTNSIIGPIWGKGNSRFEITPTSNSSVWFDDAKYYTVSTFGYDPVADGASCSVASASAEYVVDTATDTISIPKGATFNEVISGLTIAGNKAFYTSDYTEVDNENYENAVDAGTKLVIRSSNGAVVKEYAITMPLVSSNVYTVDDSEKTISGVKYYTTVENFLSKIDAGENTAEVYNGAVKLANTDYIKNGYTLKVADATYTIKLKAAVIDLDFTSDPNADLIYYGVNSSWATEESKGGKSFKLFDDGATFNVTTEKTFSTSGFVNFEISFMTPDYKSTKTISPRGAGANDWFAEGILQFDTNGDVKFIRETIMKYETNTWYNFAICINPANDSYVIYVNGEKLKEGTNEYIQDGFSFVKFTNSTVGKNSVAWIDDFRIYETDTALTYDAAFEGSSCAIESDDYTIWKDKIIVDDASKVELATVLSGVNALNGASAVVDGNFIKVTSANGNVFKKYSVVSEIGEVTKSTADSATIVSLPVTAGNATKNVRLLVGVYSGTEFEKVYVSEKTSVTGAEDVTVKITDDLTGKTLKAFVWQDLTTLVPLKGVTPLD